MKKIFLGALAAILLATVLPARTAIRVESQNCNFAENPAGVDPACVRFGWTLTSDTPGGTQTAWEIMVASRPELLRKGRPDLWSSGKTASDESRMAAYGGKPLENGRRYWWKVRVWDSRGKASPWSPAASFITAQGDDYWEAPWIGAIRREDSRLPEGNNYHTPGLKPELSALWDDVEPLAKRSIMLRRDFTVGQGVAEALVNISGLGHYDLWVNGNRVDTSVFKPLWSEYDRTVYYNTWDIAPLLREGANTIGVVLGNGMYNVAGGRYTKFRVSYGPPTLMLQADIRYGDGQSQRVQTGADWKYDLSPVTFNCIHGGEDYDARLEQPGWNTPGFDDSGWKAVVVQDAPKGKLRPQTAPPVTVAASYGVAGHRLIAPHSHLFDMGQNLSGYPTLTVRGKKGQKVRLLPGEQLAPGGERINQGNTGSPYWFEYTLRGDGIEQWTPQFAYYGYQYIEVHDADWLEGDGDDRPVILALESNFIHSSAPSTSSFECSNELFNRIHFIIDKAARSNMQAVMSDCPHREKLGWLGDLQTNLPWLLYNYDLRTLVPKIMRDIADTQRPDGLVPDIAPEYVVFKDGFVDTPEWGAACAILPWRYYEAYGDDSLIREYYPVMARYTDYLASKADDEILAYGLGDWCDYGPRPAGNSQNTPLGITATGHYYIVADLTARAAAIAGDNDGATRYSTLAARIAEAFNTHLFDPATAVYGNGSQCSYAIPLHLGIVPEEHREKVVTGLLGAVDGKDGRLSTGLVGNRFLFQSLAENGHNDTVYRMHDHTDVPGYGLQVEMGITTLAEQWDPHRGMSWNHYMMGQIEEWFWRSLAGIRPDPENPGYRHFFVEPAVAGDLTWVKAGYESICGTIVSDWRIDGNVFTIRVAVPANTTATLVMPFGGRTHRLGAGEHTFSVTKP